MKVFNFDKPITLEPGWYYTGDIMQQKGKWIEMHELELLELIKKAITPFDTVSIQDSVEFRRTQYGLTMPQIALVLGIERSHYNEFLKGRRELPKKAMARAYAIGVPADVLFQRKKG